MFCDMKLIWNTQGENTMNRLFLMCCAAVVLLMTGCASNLMKPSDSGEVQAPPSDKATVVFMRTSFVASGVGVEMFEIVDGELEFIGALPSGNKIAHKTTEGRKVYMAYGSAADFMIADVKAGKTYYSIVRPNWGTGGFAPTPIRKEGSEFNMKSSEFAGWVKGTKLLELKKDEANKWFAENKSKYEAIYKDYWERFQHKTPAEVAQRSMNPDDGV